MGYRVDLTARAGRDLRRVYERIRADDSALAFAWFNGLEKIIYTLAEHPSRGAITPESKNLRHSHYGNKPHMYRVVYRIDERAKQVKVLHIRHGARDAFTPGDTR